MGYVAIRGGEQAIDEAARALEYLRVRENGKPPVSVDAITTQFHALHGRVLSEGSLYDPELAALALKQTGGDTLEASFLLRAYRSTRPRLADSPVHSTRGMRLIRRISAAFKDIPGGQMLGPTPDYLHRLLRFELADETPEAFRAAARSWLKGAPAERLPESFPKVLDYLRAEGLLEPAVETVQEPFDITRRPLVFPAPRSAALATLSRGETGSVLAIAYSSMRGYGDVHPTVAELRVGYVPVRMPHAITGEPVEVGEVLMTECEVVAMFDKVEGQKPAFGIGYGACFGHNEVKAISMAILDRALQLGARRGPRVPAEDPEFVLLHVDGVDAMGFCQHYKMPHYVTFQSDLDRLRAAQAQPAEVIS
ncbi:MAG: carbon-phosphorus lyase complex subunit PhnI [Planctomycetes bacterium]|nr:carbon-phosphorus lyase complex subunit PhnI [Planctomycetota bacterium]